MSLVVRLRINRSRHDSMRSGHIGADKSHEIVDVTEDHGFRDKRASGCQRCYNDAIFSIFDYNSTGIFTIGQIAHFFITVLFFCFGERFAARTIRNAGGIRMDGWTITPYSPLNRATR